MKKTLGAILTAAALVLPAAAAQADKKMTLDQVPTKAQETIKNHVKDGQILEIEKDKEYKKNVYEVEYKTSGGEKHEIEVAEDGSLVSHMHD